MAARLPCLHSIFKRERFFLKCESLEKARYCDSFSVFPFITKLSCRTLLLLVTRDITTKSVAVRRGGGMRPSSIFRERDYSTIRFKQSQRVRRTWSEDDEQRKDKHDIDLIFSFLLLLSLWWIYQHNRCYSDKQIGWLDMSNSMLCHPRSDNSLIQHIISILYIIIISIF